LVLCLAVLVRAADKPLPNILHINADDHRADGLHALGNAALQTPNLDTLVERGMVFTRCYTMGSMIGAVCTPSRTMLLTGRSWQRIPKAPGARPNADDPATFLPRVLAAAGYQTFHAGKTGNAFSPGIQAFETSLSLDDKVTGGRANASRTMADRAVEFLGARNREKPFYMYLAPPVPHDPRSAEAQFHALYDPSKLTLSPAFLPQHPFDNGEMAVRDEKLAPWPRTPEDTLRQTADYDACVTGLDAHIGRIFEALKSRGDWADTVIVFTGDNGLSLGEHGLFGKQNLYEFGGMHVPLVIAGPGIPKGKSEALAYLMDLFPTFCELAGAKVPDGVDAMSLLPVIRGSREQVRDVLYTGYRDCQRSVRADRWKLIRYPLVDRTQLFDLASDPHELNNLSDRLEHADKVTELMAVLQREMTAYGDPYPLTVPNPKPAAWSPPAVAEPAKPGKRQKNKGYAENKLQGEGT
jgi:arylsulfatase A-like enzyme